MNRTTKLSLLFIGVVFISNILQGQERNILDELTKQDSSIVKNKKWWMSIGIGNAYSPVEYGGIINPDIAFDITYIDKNYRVYKFKTAKHIGLLLFSNSTQYINEYNLMSGSIRKKNNHFIEFYYGIGIVNGVKHLYPIYNDSPGFSFSLTTHYVDKVFLSIGIPFEYKFVFPSSKNGSGIGIGFDANLNPYIPYFGINLSLILSKRYAQ